MESNPANEAYESTPDVPTLWNKGMDGTLPCVQFEGEDFWTTPVEEETHPESGIPRGAHGRIVFQHGPIKEVGVNGTTIEAVQRALINRLRGFNEGPFRCRENSLAITHMEEALHWLNARTQARQHQNVEGVAAPHTS